MTNSEKLRQMTDEELAVFLSDTTQNAYLVLTCFCDNKTKSVFDWLAWLKEESELI